MLFTDLLEACVERVLWDAYFADPEKGISCIAADRMDLISVFDEQLARLGMGVVVEITQAAEVEGRLTEVNVVFQVHEVPAINRVEGGAQKKAHDAAVKIISLIKEWTPDEGVWHPFRFVRWGMTEVDQEHGRIVWTLEMQTSTIMETVVEVLATEDGRALVTEEGLELLVSPTDP